MLFFGPRVWPLPHRVGSTGSPYVRGGPRLNGRSFGLCWNSGQNDLHIEFLVLLPLHRLQIVATTHLHIFRDPSERISNVEVLSRPLDYPHRKVYSSFSWGYYGKVHFYSVSQENIEFLYTKAGMWKVYVLLGHTVFFPESEEWRYSKFDSFQSMSEFCRSDHHRRPQSSLNENWLILLAPNEISTYIFELFEVNMALKVS